MSFKPERLFQLDSANTPSTRAAILVKKTRYGTHAGIWFVDENNICWILHLRGHFDLECKQFTTQVNWFVAVPDIDPEKIAVFAGLCMTICKKMPRIPYALRHIPGTYFDLENVEIKFDGKQYGLTCATFAMVILKRAGIDIVDMSNWPSRESDRPFQEIVLATMRAMGAKAEHIQNIESEIGCPRFRPEEVSGACLHSHETYPVSQADCEVSAHYVLSKLPAVV